MKKLQLFSFLFVLLSFSVIIAQSNRNVEKGLFKINALTPGVAYELGVGKNSTLNFEASVIPITQVEFNTDFEVELFPAVGAEFRYFTNMKRRLGNGKNISGNTGNYIAFLNQAFITAPILGNIEYDEPVAYLGSFVYGLQRTYNKGFYFNVAGGPAFFTGDNDPQTTLYLDVRLGWLVNWKKKNK